MLDVLFTNTKRKILPILGPETDLGRFELWKQSKPVVQRLVSIVQPALEGFCFWSVGENKTGNKPKATEICWIWCLLSQMFTFDSKHTRIGYKIRAQEQEETFEVVNRRQFGGNLISIHSQAPHVQGHFEIWKQVFTETVGTVLYRHFESPRRPFSCKWEHSTQLFSTTIRLLHRSNSRSGYK